ncbi:energy transducer TonB [Propionivibrio sp.]|uniref:energy transducer TonB n=1 Tax=Propionivibrio sp. TaxID=2212460 RepID=UPI003BF187A5
MFVSIALHLLVLAFPYFGETTGHEQATTVVGKRSQSSSLKATLGHTVRAVGARRAVPLRTARPEPEQKTSTSSSGVSPILNFTHDFNLVPSFSVDYYPTSELTVKPQALGEAILDSEDGVALIASGRLVLVLWINEKGEVVDISVDNNELPDSLMQSTLDALKKLRFSPGELNGQKVGALMRIEVSYDDEYAPTEP